LPKTAVAFHSVVMRLYNTQETNRSVFRSQPSAHTDLSSLESYTGESCCGGC
jgi:hypothetical protein